MQTSIVPFHAEKSDQSTSAGFEIGHGFFVGHVVDGKRHDLGPMAHQAIILPVVLPKLGQIGIVAEGIGEIVHETGRAIVHRVTPAVDDAGIWQNEADEGQQGAA